MAGCVHAPATGQTCTAGAGLGARLDGARSGWARLRRWTRPWWPPGSATARERRAPAGAGAAPRCCRRCATSAGWVPALDLCAVAAGRLDGYYEQGLKRGTWPPAALVPPRRARWSPGWTAAPPAEAHGRRRRGTAGAATRRGAARRPGQGGTPDRTPECARAVRLRNSDGETQAADSSPSSTTWWSAAIRARRLQLADEHLHEVLVAASRAAARDRRARATLARISAPKSDTGTSISSQVRLVKVRQSRAGAPTAGRVRPVQRSCLVDQGGSGVGRPYDHAGSAREGLPHRVPHPGGEQRVSRADSSVPSQ